jgi:hypothetical protein
MHLNVACLVEHYGEAVCMGKIEFKKNGTREKVNRRVIKDGRVPCYTILQ